MDQTKFTIDATIRGIRLICEEHIVDRNRILIDGQNIVNSITTLKAKVLSTYYAELASALDIGLTDSISIYVGNKSYPNAKIQSYSIHFKSGSKTANVHIVFNDNDE